MIVGGTGALIVLLLFIPRDDAPVASELQAPLRRVLEAAPPLSGTD